MKLHRRTVGVLTLLALIGAAVGWAELPSGGSDPTTGSKPRAASVSQPPSANPAATRRLPLFHRGQPIVWLRHDAEVPLRASPGGRVVKTLSWQTQFGSRTVLAVFHHRAGWAAVPTPLLPNDRLGWVKLDPRKLRSGWTRYEIDVDLSRRAAQLRLRDRVLRSFAVTIGAPTAATPTGRFAITDTFRGNLNPAYGCCALATTATQPSLPSGWLGGNRIAIHGTTGPVGAAISHGCIRAANGDANALVNRVPLGTPVIIRQ